MSTLDLPSAGQKTCINPPIRRMSARLAGKAQNINGSADGEDAAGKKHRGILRRRRFRGTELSDSDSAPSIPRNRPLSPTHPATKRKAKGAPTGLNRSPKRTRGPVSRDRNTKHVARGSDHDITMDKRSFHTGSPFLGGRVVRSPSLQTPDTDQASLQAPIAALISHVSATGANPDTDTDSIPSIPRNRPLSPTREGVKRKAKENPAGTDSPPPKRIRQHPTGLKHFRLRRSHIARDGGHAHRYITPARNYRVENDVAGDFKNAQVAEWLRQIHVQGDIVMDNGDLRESSDTEMQYTNNDGSLSVRCVGADDDGTSDAVPVDAAPVDAAPVDAAPVEPFVSRSPSIHSPRVADTECSPGDVLPVNARLLQSLPTQPTGVAADELPIDVQRHCELSMDSCASATDKPADQVSTQALSTPNPAILVPGSEGTPARGILRSPSVESSRIANVDQPVNVLANGEHELFMGACASALEQHTNQVSMPPLSEKAPSAILESKRSERSYEPDPSVPSSGAADEEQGSSTRTRDSASIQSADQTPIPGVSAHAPLTTLTPTGSDGVSEQSISRKSSVESSEIVDNESLIACREHKQIMGTCASVPEQCANQVSTLSVFENSRSVLPSPSVPSSDEQESTNTRGSVSINPVNQTSMHAPGHFIRLSAPDHSASSTQALPMSVFENAASVPRGTENGHNPAISGPLDISLRSRESRLPNGVIDSPSQVWSTKSTSDAIRITSSLPSSHPPPPSNSGGSEIDTGEGMLGRARRHPILDVCDESVSMDNDWPREDKSISPQMEIEGSERTSNGTESVLHSYYLGSQSGIKSGDSDGPREDTTSRNDVDENAAGNVQHALSEQLQASHHDLLATHSNSPVIPVDLMNADEEEFEYIDIDGVSSDSQGRDDSAGEPHIENSDEDIYSDWSGIQKQQAAPMDTEDDELSSNGDSSVEDEDISSEWNGLNEQQTLSMDIGDDELSSSEETRSAHEECISRIRNTLLNQPDTPATKADVMMVLDAIKPRYQKQSNAKFTTLNQNLTTIVDLLSHTQNNATQVTQPGPDRSSRRKEKRVEVNHRPYDVTTLQRDIRSHTLQLMNRPNRSAPFTSSNIAESKEVSRFNAKGAGGPTLERFCVDLAGKPTSKWNKRAAIIFRQDFINCNKYECTDPEEIETRFLTHLRALDLQYRLLEEQQDDSDDEARDSDADDEGQPNTLDVDKTLNARKQRRYALAVRRLNVAKVFPDMKRFIPLLQRMSTDAHSGDESDHHSGNKDGRRPRYAIVGIPWRAPVVTRWIRDIDRVHLSTHFKSNGRATPGAFPRYRIASTRVEHNGEVVKGLPGNFYDPAWLETLDDLEMEELNRQPDVDFSHTTAIRELADRFKGVTGPKTPPVPNKHHKQGQEAFTSPGSRRRRYRRNKKPN